MDKSRVPRFLAHPVLPTFLFFFVVWFVFTDQTFVDLPLPLLLFLLLYLLLFFLLYPHLFFVLKKTSFDRILGR